MEDSIHGFIGAHTLGVVATNNSTQCLMQSDVVFLHHLVVANNIDSGIGGNKGYLINLLVAEEVIGHFDNTFLSYLTTMQVITYRNTVADRN